MVVPIIGLYVAGYRVTGICAVLGAEPPNCSVDVDVTVKLNEVLWYGGGVMVSVPRFQPVTIASPLVAVAVKV